MNVGSQDDEAELLERPPGELAGSTMSSSTILDETAMKLEVRGTPSARLVEILRASEERFRALLDFAPDAAVIVDDGGRITLINEQTERLFGYARAELIGRSVEVLLPDQLQAIHVVHRNGYLADPKTRSMGAGLELAGRRKDGTEFPIDISLSAITTDGSLLAMAYIRDITERKGAERSLIRQAAWVELAHDPIFSWVFGGEITHWNAEAEQTYGFAREEALGQRAHDLLCTEFSEPLEVIQAHLLRDGQWESELVQRRRDGSAIIVHTRWQLNLGPDGMPIGVMEVNRDITSRKRAESEAARQTLILEQTIAQLASSNEELEQFAYIASHDLSEPLRSISSPIALVAHRYRGQLDPDTDRFIDFAVEGCQRMQTIIDDLLAFSRAGRGAALEWVDCNLLVNTVMSDLTARIAETGARLHVGNLPTVAAQRAHLPKPHRQRPQVRSPRGGPGRLRLRGRGGRRVAFQRDGQRDWDQARIPGANLRDVQAPSHPGRVRRHGDRPRPVQEDR